MLVGRPSAAVSAMRRLLPALLVLLAMTLLAACAGGPPKRIFPPAATVQELRLEPDGAWTLRLRIQNYSTVPMRFDRVDATLTIDGQEAGRMDFDPGLSIGPGSAESFEQRLAPAAGPKAAVEAALAARRGVRYQLQGRIASAEHKTNHDIAYQSALDPVPGLDGVLR